MMIVIIISNYYDRLYFVVNVFFKLIVILFTARTHDVSFVMVAHMILCSCFITHFFFINTFYY